MGDFVPSDVFELTSCGNARKLKEIGSHQQGLAALKSTDNDKRTPAHIAANLGHVEVLRVLHELGVGATFSSKDNDGNVPAHYARSSANSNVFRVLHELGYKQTLYVRNMDGCAPVHIVAQCGNVEAIRVLFEIGGLEMLCYLSGQGLTAAHTAATGGRGEVLHVLHELGAESTFFCRDRVNGYTPAHHAVGMGHAHLVHLLHELGYGKTLLCVDDRGYTAAFHAAINGNSEVIRALHQVASETLRSTDSVGHSFAHVAASYGHDNAIRLLHQLNYTDMLSARADDGDTPIFSAVAEGHISLIQVFCELGARDTLFTTNIYGCTPAHIAAQKNFPNGIRILCECGAADTLQVLCNTSGFSPAHWAASLGHGEVIRAIHKMGFDTALSLLSSEGLNLAHIAADEGRPDVLRVLHEIGMGDTLSVPCGTCDLSPAHYACLRGHKNVLRILHELGATLTAKDSHGIAPAHLAIHHPDVFRELHHLIGDVAVSVRDKNGCTPVFLAADKGMEECIRMFHEIGAAAYFREAKSHGITPILACTHFGNKVLASWMQEKSDSPSAGMEAAAGASRLQRKLQKRHQCVAAQKGESNSGAAEALDRQKAADRAMQELLAEEEASNAGGAKKGKKKKKLAVEEGVAGVIYEMEKLDVAACEEGEDGVISNAGDMSKKKIRQKEGDREEDAVVAGSKLEASEKKKKKKKVKKGSEVEDASQAQVYGDSGQGGVCVTGVSGGVGSQDAQLKGCIVCLKNCRSWCLIPCGHTALCDACADFSKFFDASTQPFMECPMCRTELNVPFFMQREHAKSIKVFY